MNDESRNKIRLKIIQLNTNDINNKMVELELLTNEHKPDVICIQESKLEKEQGPQNSQDTNQKEKTETKWEEE